MLLFNKPTFPANLELASHLGASSMPECHFQAASSNSLINKMLHLISSHAIKFWIIFC